MTNAIPPNRRQRGGAVVEASLIFTLFACLLLGAFDFGQFLFIHQALVERARSAVRWGAINDPTDTDSITNMVLYNQATAGTDSYFGLTASNVAVSATGAGTDNYNLKVTISGYTYSVLSPYISGQYTGPLISVSVPLGLYN
jgi:hypothetical protein